MVWGSGFRDPGGGHVPEGHAELVWVLRFSVQGLWSRV